MAHFAAESHVDRSIRGPEAFIETNVTGTLRMLEAVRAYLGSRPDKKDSFRFLHVSTDEVFGTLGPADPKFSEDTPYSPNSPYAASKAAVDTLTRGLALEIAAEGVRVNAVRPGIIDTELHAQGGDPGRVDRLGPAQPIGRPGTASEVAAAIAWFLSSAASFVTGTVLDVSGGR